MLNMLCCQRARLSCIAPLLSALWSHRPMTRRAGKPPLRAVTQVGARLSCVPVSGRTRYTPINFSVWYLSPKSELVFPQLKREAVLSKVNASTFLPFSVWSRERESTAKPISLTLLDTTGRTVCKCCPVGLRLPRALQIQIKKILLLGCG